MRFTKNTNNILTFIKAAILVTITVLLMLVNQAQAQQMVVDDAAVTTERSFQIESWYGSEESVFMPAVSLTPWLELVGALGFDTQDNFALANYAFELKGVSADFEEAGSAYGLVAGVVLDIDGGTEEVFAYVPYSKMILDDRAVLHLNAGWAAINEDDYNHEIIYGVRGDFEVHDRVTILAEVFTANLDTPSFHGGLRFNLIDGLLEMDVTYGQGFDSAISEPGFNVGIAYTPSSIW